MKKSILIFGATLALFSACKHKDPDPIVCDFNPTFSFDVSNTTCTGSVGSVVVHTSIPATQFSIDSGVTYQSDSIFEGLSEGKYTVFVKDVNSCIAKDTVSVGSETGSLDFTYTTTGSGCGNSNGTVTITATGSSGYKYSINGILYQTENVIIDIPQGTHSIYVKDTNNCEVIQSVKVNAGDVSYANDIKAIITQSCATTNCHDGSNSHANLTTYNGIFSNKSGALTRLKNGSMPKAPQSISAANKEKFICWLNDGAPNN